MYSATFYDATLIDVTLKQVKRVNIPPACIIIDGQILFGYRNKVFYSYAVDEVMSGCKKNCQNVKLN